LQPSKRKATIKESSRQRELPTLRKTVKQKPITISINHNRKKSPWREVIKRRNSNRIEKKNQTKQN